MPLAPDARHALIQAVRDAAKAEIIPRFRRLDDRDVQTKSGALDLVTEADTCAEAAIRKSIATILPGARVVGEEGVATDPAELDQIGLPGVTVVVDPVDGTWNFARGLALFGTILAVIEDGETVFGLLYDPLADAWIEAAKGEGSWYVVGENRTRLTLGAPPPLAEMTGLHSAYGLTPSQWAASAALQPRFGRVTSLRASLWDYRLQITGGAGFCLNRYLNVWDHAAGVLALTEAGGYAALLDGRPYDPALREGYLLTAQSKSLWDQIAPDFAAALGARSK
ncbi:MAG: inositol monophosphatase [Pseudomonadota bacterium]